MSREDNAIQFGDDGVPRISTASARDGAKGYTVKCVSIYSEDLQRLDRLKSKLGKSHSEIIRIAIKQLEETPA